MRSLIARARRASKKSPRELAARIKELGEKRIQRPWSRVYPRLLTTRAVVKASGVRSVDELWEAASRRPFFLSPSDCGAWSKAFRVRYPNETAAIVAVAERVLRHEFDLLGSGRMALGRALPWHTDFKTGREWPMDYGLRLQYDELDRPTDVKVPWELSRCQHFTALGQAYWLTGDERFAQEFVDEVTDWIARNPWSYGVNWACAMDVALRAISWIWGFYFLAEAKACAPSAFRGAFLRALYLHGDYVAAHLERADVNGNHYLSDAAGLIFLGLFFRTAASGQRWLAIGREIVDTELFKQTSADGVDYEKSTAYHRLVLELVLTSGLLLERHGDSMRPEWLVRLEKMFDFVEAYIKPDGSIPLVGDADDGRVQKLGVQALNDHRYLLALGAVLFDRADFKRSAGCFWDEAFWLLGPDGAASFDAIEPSAAPIASRAFDDGGYYVLRSARAHVFVDCGEVGMLGRGGHGHNDITSVEIWLDGMNLVSDCGAYLYTASREWRNRFRGTAFHNVVQVDGEELNRFVSPDHLWQLRDDARPRQVEWRWSADVDRFRGSHDGYTRLDPPVLVTREVALAKDGPDVIIRDAVTGAGSRELVWRFHLAPALSVRLEGDGVRLAADEREAWLQTVDTPPALRPSIVDGWISPSYGVRLPSKVVTFSMRTALPASATFRIGAGRAVPSRLRALADVSSIDAAAVS